MDYTMSMDTFNGYKNLATMIASKTFVPKIERKLTETHGGGIHLSHGTIRRHLLLLDYTGSKYNFEKLPTFTQELMMAIWADIDWDTLFAEAENNLQEKLAITSEM
jgi:hypothetical protein